MHARMCAHFRTLHRVGPQQRMHKRVAELSVLRPQHSRRSYARIRPKADRAGRSDGSVPSSHATAAAHHIVVRTIVRWTGCASQRKRRRLSERASVGRAYGNVTWRAHDRSHLPRHVVCHGLHVAALQDNQRCAAALPPTHSRTDGSDSGRCTARMSSSVKSPCTAEQLAQCHAVGALRTECACGSERMRARHAQSGRQTASARVCAGVCACACGGRHLSKPTMDYQHRVCDEGAEWQVVKHLSCCLHGTCDALL